MAKDFYEIVKKAEAQSRAAKEKKGSYHHQEQKKSCNEKPPRHAMPHTGNQIENHKRRRLKPRVKRGV
jgi:hypothetical protein